jgi:hypothetical protein
VNSEAGGPALPSTCPTCGATVRSDVSWCTQCYTPLLPEPDEPPAPASEPAEEAEQHLRPGVQPGTKADPAEVERLAAQMLAELAATPDELHGLTSHLPSTAATRALAVAGVIVVGSALVLLLMFLVGTAL